MISLSSGPDSLAIDVASDKMLNVSRPQFPQLQNEGLQWLT